MFTLAWLACLACRPTVSPAPPPARSSTSPAATPPTRDSLRGPVVSIDITGTSRTSDAGAALNTVVGAAYDPAVISRDVHALWRLRGISDIQVDARPVAGGVALRYRIRELPRIRKIDVEGGPLLYASRWRTRLADTRDVPQDPAILAEFAEELRAELTGHAYLDATVDWRIVEADEGRVDVVLQISEGPQVKLAALTLRGNKQLTTAELTTLFRGHGLAVGQPFTRAAQDAAQLGVIARYQDVGHLNAECVASPAIRSADGATISATYELREGDVVRLGRLTVRGALIAPVREYERLLGVRRGQPFNRSRVAQGLEDIRKLHRERGGQPNVTVLTDIDPKTKKLDLTVEISNQ